MLKPLVYFDQEDPQTHYRTDEFVFGEHILVCPILEPNSVGRRMYVPRGNWYNYWTGEFIEGQREAWIACEYDQIPIFVKEGAVIPKYPVQQYVGEKDFDEISLDVYFKNGKEKSVLYEDSQDGYDYNKGRFNLSTFKVSGKENELVVQQHREGNFETGYSKYRINLYGLPFAIGSVRVNNEILELSEGTSIVVDHNFDDLRIYGDLNLS